MLSTNNNVSAPGIANATPAALEMLAMARTSGRQDNAYASALALERGIKSESGGLMYVDWDTADPASVPVMDSADLFGDEKAGHYLVGRLSTKRGVVIGSLYVRGDGMAMYRPSMADESVGEYWGQDGLRDVEEEGGGEDWQEFVGWHRRHGQHGRTGRRGQPKRSRHARSGARGVVQQTGRCRA